MVSFFASSTTYYPSKYASKKFFVAKTESENISIHKIYYLFAATNEHIYIYIKILN